ncbi:MAG TPA: ISAzo13 family transposase [Polyangiaceae bacterium]
MTFPIEKKETTTLEIPGVRTAKNDRLHAVDDAPLSKNVERIRQRYEALAPVMDERMARLWAAAEAKAIGRGGTAAVAKATGILGKRILAGKRDLVEVKHSPTPLPPGPRRIRRPGGGRKSLEKRDPLLFSALLALVDPAPDGGFSPLRWTCRSTRQLAAELSSRGHPVGATKVRKMLLELGYSLRGSRQGRDAPQRPGRHSQFAEINRLATAFHSADQPVIWLETRRKRTGEAIAADLEGDQGDGWADVGIEQDTADLASEAIRQWWRRMGRSMYPGATELMIVADAAGKEDAPARYWKQELQRLADDAGVSIRFCHYPPGTTKWHKIEHRLHCHMTESRRGQAVESAERIVNLVAPTAVASVDPGTTRLAFDDKSIDGDPLCKGWNYALEPSSPRPGVNAISAY